MIPGTLDSHRVPQTATRPDVMLPYDPFEGPRAAGEEVHLVHDGTAPRARVAALVALLDHAEAGGAVVVPLVWAEPLPPLQVLELLDGSEKSGAVQHITAVFPRFVVGPAAPCDVPSLCGPWIRCLSWRSLLCVIICRLHLWNSPIATLWRHLRFSPPLPSIRPATARVTLSSIAQYHYRPRARIAHFQARAGVSFVGNCGVEYRKTRPHCGQRSPGHYFTFTRA